MALAAEEGGFDYVSDAYADDLPYWVRIGARDQLIVPYTLDANDMRFAVAQGFNSGEQFFAYLRDSFDALYAEGEAGRAKMLSIGLHCRLVGRPGRIVALRSASSSTRRGMRACGSRGASTSPATGGPCIRRLPRGNGPQPWTANSFVARFGGVFEHSPWIAERAWEDELGPAHDTAYRRAERACAEVQVRRRARSVSAC